MSSGSRHSSYSRCCCITIEVGVLLSLVLLIVLSLYLLYDNVISILDKFVPLLAETLKNWRLTFFLHHVGASIYLHGSSAKHSNVMPRQRHVGQIYY